MDFFAKVGEVGEFEKFGFGPWPTTIENLENSEELKLS